jgi:predicted dehydrogenase
MSTATRIGLVGCGAWGRNILRDLVALDCDVCVAARSDESRRRAAEAGVAIASSIDELPEVGGIVVAVPTTAHADVARTCLERGVPVFVEKPLATDAEQARQLAVDADGRLFVMDKWRYHPAIEELAGIARSGELGRPLGVRAIRTGWGHPYPDVDPTWVLLPHDLAIGLEILGELPPCVAALAEMIGGKVWGMQALLGPRPWMAIESTAASHSRRREVRLLCEHGTAWMADPYAENVGLVRTEDVGREPELRPISTELPLLRELRAFVEHVAGGPAPKSSATDGALVVERLEELRTLALAGPWPGSRDG